MRRRVHVSGRVQGVGFRWGAAGEARRLGLSGTVRNLRDGRVETVVEGEIDAVERMIAWLRHGPPLARVEHVEVDEPPEPPRPDGDEPRPGFRIL